MAVSAIVPVITDEPLPLAFLADLIRKDTDKVLIVDVLLAIGEGNKPIVGLLQLLAGKGEAELFETMSECGAAGVFAKHEMRFGHADEGGDRAARL